MVARGATRPLRPWRRNDLAQDRHQRRASTPRRWRCRRGSPVPQLARPLAVSPSAAARSAHTLRYTRSSGSGVGERPSPTRRGRQDGSGTDEVLQRGAQGVLGQLAARDDGDRCRPVGSAAGRRRGARPPTRAVRSEAAKTVAPASAATALIVALGEGGRCRAPRSRRPQRRRREAHRPGHALALLAAHCDDPPTARPALPHPPAPPDAGGRRSRRRRRPTRRW